MAHYMALLYYPQDRYWDVPEELRFLPGYGEFGEAAREAGTLVAGEPLHPVGSATTITVADGKGGEVMITDGPYADAKEVLGGFFVLDAADLDEAIRWAAQIPAAWRGKVEVRPIATRSDGAAGA
ncbi:MAG: YciI family protein [Actinomycetota bacterium]|nr:YciI family protein [Actinomycetota bacterium]